MPTTTLAWSDGSGRPGMSVVRDPADDDVAALYTTAWPRLLRLMTMRTRDQALAEEISQEALLRLAVQIRGGRRPDNVAAWLARVAINLATSHGRHTQAARRHAERVSPPVCRSPEDEAVDREHFRSMDQAFGELRPGDRQLLLLSANGHSGLEIARWTGLTHGAVRTRLHRLRAQLQARLAQLEAA